MIKEKRIPTIVGIVFLIVCVVASVYLTQFRTTWGPKASGNCLPINPQVTNITYSSADISFTTSSACLVSLSTNSQTFTDLKSSSRIHYFQVTGLKAATLYTYSLISDGQTITNSSYSFRTATKPSSSLPTSNLAWGKVVGSTDAIVYLNIPGAAPLSSFVTTNGNWSISLANSFNDAKNNWFTPPTVAVEEDIVVISDDGQTTQVTNTTNNNNPVPDIIIGQDSALSAQPTVSSGQIASISPVVAQKNLSITNPKEGETLSVNLPDFFGTAPVNTRVVVEITGLTSLTGDTMSTTAGSWHWSPSSPLSSGEKTIIAKVQNQNTGAWDTVSRKFTIQTSTSSSSPLSYEASGSATTATPIPTQTPVPTVRVAHPSTTSTPPVTGNSLPTVAIAVCALIFFLISFKFIQ